MGKGGPQPGSGRPKGSKNKSTLQREEQARLAAERLRLIDEMTAPAQQASQQLAAAKTSGVKLSTDVLRSFMELFAGLAAMYQPLPAGRTPELGRTPDETLFRVYATLAKDTAKDLAPYEAPRLSAVMVGAAIVNKVEVVGGMPDDFAPPVDAQIAPGTVITPDDDAPPPVLKVVGGE